MNRYEMLEKIVCHCDHDACRTCKLSEQKEAWCNKYNTATIPDDKVEQVYMEIFGEIPVDYLEDVEIEEIPVEDNVNHPNHYTNGGMECIEEMVMIFGKEAVMNFCICNAWKYRRRALYKNGEEDIQKSHWYLAKYKELKEGVTNE